MARTVLPSGLRIVTEEEKSVRSAAFGIWVNVGSRDESNSTAGASHFLEHLLFKGTKKRTSLEISSSIEAVGGETNAFTSKEYTCFYARVIDKDLPLAVDVISDLITSSVVRPVDVDAERKVVLEEIAMRDDDPSDLIHDLFLVPLNSKCSRKCEAPAVELDSSREPTLTQIPKAAERTDFSSSVTIRRPLGKTVLAKLL